MLFDLISSGFNKWYIIQFLLSLPIIVFSLTIHEYAHGYSALKCGDHTAENLGRLDLNPLRHLDPIGTLCMLVCGIGWAKPVPVNSRNFGNPRRDMAITAAAGPLANIVLSFVFALLMKLSEIISHYKFNYIFDCVTKGCTPEGSETLFTVLFAVMLLMLLGMKYNIYLAIFNLLPIPPFDGSRIFYIFLPPKYYFGIMKYERFIMIAVLILLWTGSLGSVFTSITGRIIGWYMTLLNI